MKLFYKPGACSLASHITLRESGKDFSLIGVDLMHKRMENGDDFLQVNPKGQVPALLLDDNTLLTEGVAIMQYIADSVADRQLLAPVGTINRYKTLEWLNFIATELHKGFTPLFRPTTPPEYRAIAIENLGKRFAWLDSVLAGRAFLHGGRFTAADAYCYTIVLWSALHRIDRSPWPHLKSYLLRVDQRPHVRSALADEQAELATRAAA